MCARQYANKRLIFNEEMYRTHKQGPTNAIMVIDEGVN
jgi:uncharacterized protein YegP (UPF0339 family)